MRPFTFCQSLVLLLALAADARAETRTETYKTLGDVKLNLTIQLPEGWRADDKRPAIIFFFGGGWNSGSTRQFENHCRYLASRGMVAMCADYRVKSRHNVKAAVCVADAKSAMRWHRGSRRCWRRRAREALRGTPLRNCASRPWNCSRSTIRVKPRCCFSGLLGADHSREVQRAAARSLLQSSRLASFPALLTAERWNAYTPGVRSMLLDRMAGGPDFAPNFVNSECELKDGRTLSGILASESAGNFTLRMAQGVEEKIAPAQIARLTASRLSLRPQEMEKAMTAPDLADLLAYLKGEQ